MATVTVIAGLPGSGKTHLLEELKEGLSGIAVSDYMKESKSHSKNLKDSQHHDALMASLKAGKDCIIADVVFVKKKKRDEFISLLKAESPDSSVKWICFANDWIQCLKNVDGRAGSDSEKFERDATTVVSLVRKYSAPEGAEMRNVWKPTMPQ